MTCGKAGRSLGAYVDGELAEPVRSSLEAHLAICGACREEVNALRSLGARLVASDPAPRVPDGFGARVLAAARREVEEEAPQRLRWSPWWLGPVPRLLRVPAPLWLAGCCTVVLALVLGMFLSLGPRAPAGDERGLARVEQYGFEWFDSMPPGSIGSAYVEVTTPLGAGREIER